MKRQLNEDGFIQPIAKHEAGFIPMMVILLGAIIALIVLVFMHIQKSNN